MKKLIIAITLLFSINSFSQSGVVIADHLNTIGSALYPTHLDSLQRGGFRVVSTLVERNAITTLRRKIGMWVYVTDSLKVYSLAGGVTNSDWAEVSFGAGGLSYTFPYSVVAPGNAIQLENDTTASPANYFYGRNSVGRRGWYSVPAPTWQQTLTAGSVLSGQNVITGDDDLLIDMENGLTRLASGLSGTTSGIENSPTQTELSSITAGQESAILVQHGSISIKPHLGQFFIDTLTFVPGTKSLRYNPTTGLVSYADTTTGGEINTASNLGGGLANWDSKSGVDLRFNSFATADFDLASNLITIDDTKWLTISAAAAAYQPLDGDLTNLAAKTGTNNIYYRSASNTWSSVSMGTGISFSGGTLSNTGAPATGGTGYIQNQFAAAQTASYWLTGQFIRQTAASGSDYLRESFDATTGYKLEWENTTLETLYSKIEILPTSTFMGHDKGIILQTGNSVTYLANAFIGIGDGQLKLNTPQTGAATGFFGETSGGYLTKRTAANFKTDLSLNNVENTALSTWAGSTNITTLGTIGTGTWNATAIGTSKGGTPTGGSTGQVLTKVSGTNYDYSWQDASGGGYTNLTQFIAQTAWRSFYSDASGDVQEQAFGTAGYVYTSNGASAVPTWQAAATGNVTKVGTPVNNQIGVWTGDGTLEGNNNFTWDGTTLTINSIGTISASCCGSMAIGATSIISLSVGGGVYYPQQISSAGTFFSNTAYIGGQTATATIEVDGGAIFNTFSTSAGDVIMKGDTDVNLFFADASKDEIFMGTTSDAGAYKLQVAGGIYSLNDIFIGASSAQIGNSGTKVRFYDAILVSALQSASSGNNMWSDGYTTGTVYRSDVTGLSQVAHTFDTWNTVTTTKLVSFKNNTVEKAYISSDGSANFGGWFNWSASAATLTLGEFAVASGTLTINQAASGGGAVSIVVAGGGTWVMTLPNNDGNSGDVLQTNGSGLLSWVAPSGGSGETNTASNLGGGLANWDSKSGVDLRFNTFASADFDLASNLITIDATKWLTISAGNAAYQALDADLTAIAALSGTNNIYYRSAANTWSSVTIGSGLTFLSGTLSANATAVQTFTPGLTNTTNIAGSTASVTNYVYDGDWIHVWGTVSIDATTSLTLSELRMDIPVSSAHGSAEIAGQATSEDNTSVSIVYHSGSLVKFRFTPQSATNNVYTFSYSYRYIAP